MLQSLVSNEVSQKIQARFSSFAAFLGTTTTFFEKYKLTFLMQTLILNKSQKWKTKLAHLFQLAVSQFETKLIKSFSFFSAIIDSFEFLSNSEAEKLASWEFEIMSKGRFFRAETKTALFHHIYNIYKHIFSPYIYNRFLVELPEICRNCPFKEDLCTGILGKILVFFALFTDKVHFN